jgi:multiple sugar transport system substrate-binding protein
MTRRSALVGTVALLAAPRILRAQAVTDITVHYAQPHIYKESYDAILAAFVKREPGIRVNLVTTPDYAAGAQLILRQAATNQLPDLSYQAFNRLRVFAERGIAQDVMPLLKTEAADPATLGYAPNLLELAHSGGIQAGIAYAASTPICYYNADLVRRAGGDPDHFPRDWTGVLALAGRIDTLGDGAEGLWFNWNGSEWMYSALLMGHGGRLMSKDETEVAFGGEEGLASLKLIDQMVRQAGMPNLTQEAAGQAFAAGKLGILFQTTALVRGIANAVGKNFELRTTEMPVIDSVRGSLPTGGAAGMVTARDATRREAAWKFLRYSTGPEGQAMMVKASGYLPCNRITVEDPAYLAAFYRETPLFSAAIRQLPLMAPWYAFPGPNSVRITQVFVDNLARIVESKAAPEQVLPDMVTEVSRLLPRRG